MNRIIDVLVRVLESLGTAPVKFPAKLLEAAKYLSFTLSVLKQILEMQKGEKKRKNERENRFLYF